MLFFMINRRQRRKEKKDIEGKAAEILKEKADLEKKVKEPERKKEELVKQNKENTKERKTSVDNSEETMDDVSIATKKDLDDTTEKQKTTFECPTAEEIKELQEAPKEISQKKTE